MLAPPSHRAGLSLRTGLATLLGAVALLASASSPRAQTSAPPALDSLENLGRALFFDRNLSFNRTQSCVSCHSPQLAFTDPRELGNVEGAVSLGADGRSLGERNAPSIEYVHFTPAFRFSAAGEPAGGFFWDGRARGLEEQAGGPPLNPAEMAMPDKRGVVARIEENSAYVSAFRALAGEDVLGDTDRAYAAMTGAIAAFERTAEFSPFDSKYDRALRGEATLTGEEALGRDLFFSRERSNCGACHLQEPERRGKREVFTNFKYFDIGTPPNRKVRAIAGTPGGYIDRGLANNPNAPGAGNEGKFKVPGLRNAAITGPYMHNGVFKELRTVLLFHQRLSQNAGPQINPETGLAWDDPEVAANLAIDDLKAAPPLGEREIGALIAFLKTLTDGRYEALVEK